METKTKYLDILEELFRQNEIASSSNTTPVGQKELLHNGSMEPLLITGVSGCFPGCESVSQFWEAIDQDKSLITEIPEDRF
ncbi:MAG: beta-ketoacyl synthase N-terminal-like domain-containing protein, partial [Bacteroidota bacterium]